MGGLGLRHHRDHQRDPLLQAVCLNGLQRGVLIALGPCNRVIEHHLSIDAVAHHQAACRLGPGRVQALFPHELRSHGVLAKSVITGFVVLAQLVSVLSGHWFEL